MVFLGLAVGGAFGALCRYLATLWLHGFSLADASFPLATLLVNVLGAFLLSYLAVLGAQGLVSPNLRIALGPGFLGALTTFSTLQLESDALLREGRIGQFTLFLFGNLLLGYLAVLLGRWLAFRTTERG